MVSRLKEYFLSRGVELLLPEELKLEDNVKDFFDLFLRDGNNLVAVKTYMSSEKLAPRIRRELEILVVNILKLKDYVDKAYIAIPEEVGLLKIPLEIFESAGVGIVKICEDRVEEVLPARAFRKLKIVFDDTLREEFQRFSLELSELSLRLEKEVTELKREISKLEERLGLVYRDLNTLKREVDALKRLERVEAVEARALEIVEEAPVEGVEGLPDFISDNPWVSILVKRGREHEG